jgi:hypothetical protein
LPIACVLKEPTEIFGENHGLALELDQRDVFVELARKRDSAPLVSVAG